MTWKQDQESPNSIHRFHEEVTLPALDEVVNYNDVRLDLVIYESRNLRTTLTEFRGHFNVDKHELFRVYAGTLDECKQKLLSGVAEFHGYLGGFLNRASTK